MTIAEELRAEGRAKALKTVNQIALEKLQEGETKGKLEGKLERNYEIAKKMLSENLLDINTIAKITDLSVDELKTLLH